MICNTRISRSHIWNLLAEIAIVNITLTVVAARREDGNGGVGLQVREQWLPVRGQAGASYHR